MRRGTSRGGPGPGFFRRARGYIDEPQPATTHPREPLQIRGWCLFPGTDVAGVVVSLNGGPPQRARIGVERQDVAGYTSHPAAPICGFEHRADLGELPDDVWTIRIEAVAHSVDGQTFVFPSVDLDVGPARPGFSDRDGAAGRLRRRSIRPVRMRVAAPSGTGLRLLACAHVLERGGGSLYLVELLRRLVEYADVSCEVVTLADGPLREQLERLGIPVHVTDPCPITSLERYEGHLAELTAWAAAGGFDAVLVNTLSSFAGGDLAERLGVPALWAVHESYRWTMFWDAAYPPGTVHPYVRSRGELALTRAAAVVFEAEATRRLFLGNAEPERLVTLPYGVELDAIDAAPRGVRRAAMREQLGIEGDAEVVLCLGTIERRKSQTMLAEAFGLIADRHPRAQLVVVGESGDSHRAGYQAALRDYVRRAGLERRVRIEPVTDDVHTWHAVADLLVCASDVESLPRVILEAMASGAPVVSTKVFGVPELIEDGRTGYLCEMRDLTDLAAVMERALAADRAERSAIARAASERVRTRHDPAAYALRFERLLRGAVADRDGVPAEWLALPDGAEEPREAGVGP